MSSARERAAEDCARGEYGRARQRLASLLASQGYDAELLAELGRICQRMGDTAEAGRYWLVSSAEGPEVDAAAAVFVRLHGARAAQVFSQLPARARKSLAAYPPAAQARLRAHGLEAFFAAHLERPPGRTATPAGAEWVGVGCLATLAAIAFLTLYGLVSLGARLF